MYINGRLDRAVDNANLGLYNYSQYGYLGLGNTSESYMDGLLDEVMVFNQSLTDMQANELSNAQAAEYGRFTVLHDAAGNLTRDHRGYEYEYDYENRMILVKKPLGAGFVAVATFEYDALGRRIEKVDAIAGTTTRYYYDDQRVAVQTLVSGGVETDDRYFVFGNYIDETLLMHAGAADLYYAHDHLYSPVALFAANGTVAERYEYDAYGQVQVLAPNYELRTTSLYANAYSFTGRELDTLDAGRRTLMYYRARTYDPETGRFMQRDPLEYVESTNIYEYVMSCPIGSLDPFGERTIAHEGNLPQNPAGFSVYYRVSISVSECPVEIDGEVFFALEWQPPGLRYVKKPLDLFNLHIEAGFRGGINSKVKYSECTGGLDSVKICGRVEAFARIDYRKKGHRDSSGRFTRLRFGAGADGGGELCMDLCSGNITFDYSINWYAYFNFGNKWYNRSYDFGDSLSGSTTLGTASGFAVLGEYCNKKPDPNNCCCLKKGAH